VLLLLTHVWAFFIHAPRFGDRLSPIRRKLPTAPQLLGL
jgi:hypothetical protein